MSMSPGVQILAALNRGPCGLVGLTKECPDYNDLALQALLSRRLVVWRLVESDNPDSGWCYYLTAAGLVHLALCREGGLAA